MMNEQRRYGLKVVTPPATEPLVLADVKTHLRVDLTEDDDLITALIVSAREYIENYLHRRLITSTWDLTLDRFPCSSNALTASVADDYMIKLPFPPVVSVTSITYVDTAGTTQTLSTSVYALDDKREPASIYLQFAQIWPATRPIQNAVTVRYVAGYGAASAVPQSIKQAMLLLIGNWYENRESTVDTKNVLVVPMAVENLLWSQRVLEA